MPKALRHMNKAGKRVRKGFNLPKPLLPPSTSALQKMAFCMSASLGGGTGPPIRQRWDK